MTTDESSDKQMDDWVKILDLKPHPEGGYYSETYRNADQCTLERYDQQSRFCSTAIYFLLRLPDSPISLVHRIKADEMWHFHAGLPLMIHVFDEKDASYTKLILDNRVDVSVDARPQFLVPHGKWFGAEILPANRAERYTLCGCTCTPGFDYKDFEWGKRSYLIEKFPAFKDLITRLTASD